MFVQPSSNTLLTQNMHLHIFRLMESVVHGYQHFLPSIPFEGEKKC